MRVCVCVRVCAPVVGVWVCGINVVLLGAGHCCIPSVPPRGSSYHIGLSPVVTAELIWGAAAVVVDRGGVYIFLHICVRLLGNLQAALPPQEMRV